MKQIHLYVESDPGLSDAKQRGVSVLWAWATRSQPPQATIRTYELIDQWGGRDEPVVNTQELARECEAAVARVARRVCYVLVGNNRLRFNLGICRLK
jgi:hypothetical protein